MKSDERWGCVYCLTNLTNGKKYIGQRINVSTVWRRWNGHVHIALGTDETRPLYRAIRKAHRRDGDLYNFTAEIIQRCLVKNLDVKEIHHIKKFNTVWPYGYNLTKGGNGGPKLPSTCKKISEYHKRRFSNPIERAKQSEHIKAAHAANPMLRVNLGNMLRGRPISAERVAKIAAGNTGKKRSKEARDNLAAGARRKYARAEERVKSAEAARRRYADVNKHVKASERAKALWRSDVVRANHLKGVEAARPKQRAATLAYKARQRAERMALNVK